MARGHDAHAAHGDGVGGADDRGATSAAAHASLGIADFAVREQIGQGAFSRVYLAAVRQPALLPASVTRAARAATGAVEPLFALKVYDRAQVAREGQARNVKREQRALVELGGHANVATLFFSFVDRSSLYLVTEWAAGGSLKDLVARSAWLASRDAVGGGGGGRHGSERRRRGLPMRRVRRYALHLARALQHIHAHGYVHRDLSPGNCLLTADDRVLLTDFGSCQRCDELHDEHPGERAKCIFTEAFASPEVIANAPATCASDRWSYACCVFTLLTGRAPFVGMAMAGAGGSFFDASERLAENISTATLRFPEDELSRSGGNRANTNGNCDHDADGDDTDAAAIADCRDLIVSLVRQVPSERAEWHDVFRHRFFAAHGSDESECDARANATGTPPNGSDTTGFGA